MLLSCLFLAGRHSKDKRRHRKAASEPAEEDIAPASKDTHKKKYKKTHSRADSDDEVAPPKKAHKASKSHKG